MKNIVVSAASLRMGGAVTIYNQFISHLHEEIGENRYFIFINKVLPQPSIDGVQYYVIDIESRKRRNWFDNKGCLEILKKEGFSPEAVISLQNTAVRCLHGLPQLVYYHQPLPFFKHFWNPFKKEERSKFLYKHFYLYFVRTSLDEHVQFVVQTEFLKRGLVNKLKIAESRVHVCFPDVELPKSDQLRSYPFPNEEISLVFPSLYSPHKSHDVLVKALGELKKNSPQLAPRIRIYITVAIGEAPALESLVKKCCVDDMICFMGHLTYETTLSLYKSATALLFPSTIETLGLPLIEAASFGLPVLAADVEYAHEVLEGYEGATFAQANNAKEWAKKIEEIAIGSTCHYSPFSLTGKAGWHDFFELI